MWKIILVLLATAVLMLMARMVYHPQLPDARLGASVPSIDIVVSAGIRG